MRNDGLHCQKQGSEIQVLVAPSTVVKHLFSAKFSHALSKMVTSAESQDVKMVDTANQP